MKTIYLLSGPTNEGYSDTLSYYLNKDLKNKNSITFISSSSNNHEKNLNYVYGTEKKKGILNHLEKIRKFNKVYIIDNENKYTNVLLKSDVIYLLGGNYKTQIDFIRKYKIDEILKNYNGILIGTSCGAMNLATEAYYSKDEDINESFFYDGIGLTDITIDPHFDINDKEKVSEIKKNSKDKVIYGVPNTSGIRIKGNEITFIGTIYMYNNRR